MGCVDKMGTDVTQRNKLETFSLTLSILNQSCHYTGKAWRVLRINHQLLLLADVVGQLVKEELQEITIIVYHKYYLHSQEIKV